MALQMRDRIAKAAQNIKPYIRHTPLERSAWLSELGKGNVYVKWDSEQVTGSFKARGAFNKLLSIKDTGAIAIAASSGNHGAACARAMNILGIKGVIYCPDYAKDAKLKAIEQYGIEVKKHGHDCVDTEVKARADAEECGAVYIPPYSDIDVIAGQGTLGVEIFEDLPSVDAVFVAVGGGGLIGGIASYLKAVKPAVQVIGCQPEESVVMWESVKAGHIMDLPSGETLSDGTAGGIEQNSPTFDLCKNLVDDWVIVSELEIGKAVYDVMEKHHKIVEGAAGVAFAAYLKTRERYQGKTAVIVSCGSNIGMPIIKRIIELHG